MVGDIVIFVFLGGMKLLKVVLWKFFYFYFMDWFGWVGNLGLGIIDLVMDWYWYDWVIYDCSSLNCWNFIFVCFFVFGGKIW